MRTISARDAVKPTNTEKIENKPLLNHLKLSVIYIILEHYVHNETFIA